MFKIIKFCFFIRVLFFFCLFLIAKFFLLVYNGVMLEIRVKASSVKEIDDIVQFFRSNLFEGYIFRNFSKVYCMKNGQYKFFLECLDFKTFKKLDLLNLSNDSSLMIKKRGRKPKVAHTL